MKDQIKMLVEQNNKLMQKLIFQKMNLLANRENRKPKIVKNITTNLGCVVSLVDTKRRTVRPIVLRYIKTQEITMITQLSKTTTVEIKGICGLEKIS